MQQRGSKTLETRLTTKRCVSELVIAQLVPILAFKVSLVWSHFSPNSCDESSWHEIITSSSVDWEEPSIWSARLGKLLRNYVGLNPLRWRKILNSFALLKAFSGDFLRQDNLPCKYNKDGSSGVGVKLVIVSNSAL